MANTFDGAVYNQGDQVTVHELMHGKQMLATVFSSSDTWTGAFYESTQQKVYELSVILDNGRVSRVPYHFLAKVDV